MSRKGNCLDNAVVAEYIDIFYNGTRRHSDLGGLSPGIVPSAYLNALSVEGRTTVWHQNLERGDSATWVAEDGGRIVGWISAGRSRDADAVPTTSEVWAIYVAPSHWRRGIGRHLWHDAERHLGAGGFSEVTLWVLKANAPAIAFYEALGCAVEAGSEQAIHRGGAELLELRLRKQLGG